MFTIHSMLCKMHYVLKKEGKKVEHGQLHYSFCSLSLLMTYKYGIEQFHAQNLQMVCLIWLIKLLSYGDHCSGLCNPEKRLLELHEKDECKNTPTLPSDDE